MTDFFDISPDAQRERLAAVAKEALNEWGIGDAELTMVKYRENAVFDVRHGSGRHAVRLHRVGYHTDDELRSELQWMRALGDSGVSVPVVVAPKTGDLLVTRRGDGLPGEIQIDLFEWIDGDQLGSVEDGLGDESAVAETFETIGAIAARVHNQASGWVPPEGFVRHAWDAEGLAGDTPFWGQYWKLEGASASEVGLMQRARRTIFEELGRFAKTSDNYSMIHADFAPENLLVDGDDVRLIDFDDAGFGWHLFEIATALYFFRGEAFYSVAFESLVKGYRKHRALSDEHLENLPLFYLARAFTYVGWVHTRPETETAQQLKAVILKMACDTAEDYLSKHAD